MLSAIEKLRDASQQTRGPLLAQLDKERPNTPAAELARDRCHHAFSALHEAHSMVQRVEATMAGHKKAGTTPDPGLLLTLNEAQEKLTKANARMPACNEAARALRLIVR
jgi:hypothetical protein